MKNRCSALWAAPLLALSVSVDAVELRGFRGFAWGTDVDSLGEARQVSADAQMQCHRREHENLIYGDSPLREVRYCFHDARLFLVVVESKVDAAKLVAEFQDTYGPPTRRAASTALWGDASSRARVEISGAPASMRIWSNAHMPRSARTGTAATR
jgi:hypothetical protein